MSNSVGSEETLASQPRLMRSADDGTPISPNITVQGEGSYERTREGILKPVGRAKALKPQFTRPIELKTLLIFGEKSAYLTTEPERAALRTRYPNDIFVLTPDIDPTLPEWRDKIQSGEVKVMTLDAMPLTPLARAEADKIKLNKST